MLLLLLALLHAPDCPAATPEPPKAVVEDACPDLLPFPPAGVTEQNAELASAHYRWLNDRACLETDRLWWGDCVKAANHANDCWWWLSQCHRASGEWRDNCLEQLRLKLGDEAYLAGRMPEPIPIQHLRDVTP